MNIPADGPRIEPARSPSQPDARPPTARRRKRLVTALAICVGVIFVFAVGCSSVERKLLFFPTHHSVDNGLRPWTKAGALIGFAREVHSPRNVWLLLHGNAGQASDRVYALSSFSAEDSVFILEYPGYGNRKGRPSREAFNQAAQEAYLFLREEHTNVPVCVVAESIGSGPACFLGAVKPAPDKLVLIVPFDQLSQVAKDHFPSILVSLVLRDNWDNVEALSHYGGPVEIFGAERDAVIPIVHARALAATVPTSKLVVIQGGHNEWASQPKVAIRYP